MESSLRLPQGVVTEALAKTGRRLPGAEGQLWQIVHQWILSLAQALLANDGQRRWLAPEDLVHETFLRVRPAYLRMAGLRRSNLQSLVLRVMRQVLIDESRRRRPQVLAAPDAVVAVPFAEDEHLRDLGERLECLSRCGSIPRRIVELHVFEGWTFAQIGDELGGSASWARKHYHAALNILRDSDVGDRERA